MNFLADTTTPSTTQYSPLDWLVIAMVTLAVSYLLLRNSAKKKRDPLADTGPRLSLAQQRATERSMEMLLVELSEMARQISSQLDTRAAKLEALIQEADEKIEKLRRMQQQRQQTQRPQGASPSQPAHRSTRPMAPAAEEEEDRPPLRLAVPESSVDPRHAEIYRLADQGQTPQQIAQRLNRPNGEIELILALRGR